MSMTRLSILAVLLALFAGSGSVLFAQAKVGDHIVTTDRLNLRGCPDTADCAVLRTLPRGTHLGVAERQGDWLRVTSMESAETGWVHAGYTQIVTSSASRRSLFSELGRRGVLVKLFVVLCILGALLTMASFGRNLRPDATHGQLFALSALSILTGAVFLLNQFGRLLSRICG